VTGIVDGTDLERPAPDADGGHVTRQRKRTDTHGQGPESEGTVEGWQRMVLSDARTKIPWAAQVVPIQEHATLCLRALVPQARTHVGGKARRHKGVVDRGVRDGAARWGLDQHGIPCVVPANTTMAVTVDARAPAAAGAAITVGRRGPTVRHGQGRAASTARLETEVGGMAGLTPDDQSGTPEPGRHHSRRAFEPNPIQAVVVRQGQGKDDGPGGTPGFLTHAAVEDPWRPFDDDDDRSRMENCWIKAATQP
jgi:hypothetical protein